MEILISGAGIAGLTTAYWLERYGHTVTLVEKVADFKERHGYLIDFWGPGFEVAEKMQILSQLKEKNYDIQKLVYVNDEGQQKGYLNIAKVRKMMNDRMCTFLRGDLENVIYEKVASKIKILAPLSIKTFQQDNHKVHVTFTDDTQADYDLLIGADGIHSKVRQLLFGPEDQFLRNLNYSIGAFIHENKFDIKNFVSYTKPGRQVALAPVKNNQLATYFMYKQTGEARHDNQEDIIEQFKEDKWLLPEILESLSQAKEVYLDTVAQVELPQWHQGRVALVGDACQCLTLLAGQGASMAMAGGYLIAKELEANLNYTQAFTHYQNQLKPDIENKQKQARGFIRQFIPNTEFGIFVRNKVSNVLNIPILTKWYFDRTFQFSRKYLPNYLLN